MVGKEGWTYPGARDLGSRVWCSQAGWHQVKTWALEPMSPLCSSGSEGEASGLLEQAVGVGTASLCGPHLLLLECTDCVWGLPPQSPQNHISFNLTNSFQVMTTFQELEQAHRVATT